MSSWKLSALLAGLVAMAMATIAVGALGLDGRGGWSIVAFVAVAFVCVGVLTVVLVPRHSTPSRPGR